MCYQKTTYFTSFRTHALWHNIILKFKATCWCMDIEKRSPEPLLFVQSIEQFGKIEWW